MEFVDLIRNNAYPRPSRAGQMLILVLGFVEGPERRLGLGDILRYLADHHHFFLVMEAFLGMMKGITFDNISSTRDGVKRKC